MKEVACYENFPKWIVIMTVSYTVITYVIGAYILAGLPLGLIWSILYIAYVILMEILLLKKSCVNCYYYGRICGFGRGKLCALLFKQGDPQKFAAREVTWRDILPDFLTIIVPVVGGIILLILNFSVFPLILVIILVLLFLLGNPIIRGSFTCKYCKQRELGCPANKLFEKGKEKKP
ncbi:MAG: hypothetical protein LUQ65_15160 [Candidatus Helarchaeota archaeon]|nr:hypothetical protein [Candidatus Helarchaeota archaeon]